MGEEQAKVLIHLLERSQQPLTAFFVEACNPVAQGRDCFFQVSLFGDKGIVFFLHFLGVFLRPQVDRAQRIPLPFVLGHLPFDHLCRRHRIWINVEAFQQLFRRDLLRFRYPFCRCSNRFPCGIGVGF